ncbi:MAG TPA: FAD-dependent oxidoreductase [Prolixibacteraceae bacterium]|nr:FAD-dependent oxidoreductase [Prolixibacteraceae bacterium]
MIKNINISVLPEVAASETGYKLEIAKQLGLSVADITHVNIVRRSIDARGRSVRINLGVEVYINEIPSVVEPIVFDYPNVTNKTEVIIVGAGPAGLFAALRLIELGIKPLIIERGKEVSERKADIAAIHRGEGVNPDSNYGYGEGGAGTFSDGKLYTRSKKRGDINKILKVFFFHGAQPEILIDAHPHIGTNVLPRVIKRIRESILAAGGEIHFSSRVIDFIIENGRLTGVETNNGLKLKGKAVILATGHSARDIYKLLHNKGIQLESKNFAVGVRVEHPQMLIDQIQYHRKDRGIYLPAATYSFVEQVGGRGVYSFCMCPGGIIVPASTSNDEMVVNGMSPSNRGGKYANSGIVVEVHTNDLKEYAHLNEMTGLKFQEDIENLSYKMAGNSHFAPAQRLSDFVSGKASDSLPETSYHPGIIASDLHRWLPQIIGERLQQGFRRFDAKARGFLTNEAVVMGVESRTSSPVRVPRNPDTFEHVQMKGLFPCGEGAGYAGGIVSSAVDGERCAEMVAALVK